MLMKRMKADASSTLRIEAPEKSLVSVLLRPEKRSDEESLLCQGCMGAIAVPRSARNSEKRASPKRVLQRWTLRREQFSTILRDVHIVFEAHAKFAADINSGFI